MDDVCGGLLQSERKAAQDIRQTLGLVGVCGRACAFAIRPLQEELGRFLSAEGSKRLLLDPSRPLPSTGGHDDMTMGKPWEEILDCGGRLRGIYVVQDQQPAVVLRQPGQDGGDLFFLGTGGDRCQTGETEASQTREAGP